MVWQKCITTVNRIGKQCGSCRTMPGGLGQKRWQHTGDWARAARIALWWACASHSIGRIAVHFF